MLGIFEGAGVWRCVGTRIDLVHDKAKLFSYLRTLAPPHLRTFGSISPAISTPEHIVINTAIDEGLPVIHLQKEPITPYWKPERRRFDACARGTLLILSPWGIEDQLPTDYQRFHFLNDLATEICNTTDATIVDIQGIMKG